MAVICLGCGAPASLDGPQPSHCEQCPPWACPDCGQMDSMAQPCGCWISLDGMAFADVKGLLALGDLSVSS